MSSRWSLLAIPAIVFLVVAFLGPLLVVAGRSLSEFPDNADPWLLLNYERFFEDLQRRFPGRAVFHQGYSEELAHFIEAAADIFLMPSYYEPCGLNQMYSLRYGTVPIVRRTGGLADSVQQYDPETGEGTGIVFNDFDAGGLGWALDTALEWYEWPDLWRQIMENGMRQDFSWRRAVGEYERLYASLLTA